MKSVIGRKLLFTNPSEQKEKMENQSEILIYQTSDELPK